MDPRDTYLVTATTTAKNHEAGEGNPEIHRRHNPCHAGDPLAAFKAEVEREVMSQRNAQSCIQGKQIHAV